MQNTGFYLKKGLKVHNSLSFGLISRMKRATQRAFGRRCKRTLQCLVSSFWGSLDLFLFKLGAEDSMCQHSDVLVSSPMLMSRQMRYISPEIATDLAFALVCTAHSCQVCKMNTLLDMQHLMHFTVRTFSIWFLADFTVKEKMQPL